MAGFSLRGAMAGLGGAMEQSGAAMLQSSLDEQRQARLMELSQAFQREAQTRSQQHDRDMVGVRSEASRADALHDVENIAPKRAAIQVDTARQIAQAGIDIKTDPANVAKEIERINTLGPAEAKARALMVTEELKAKGTPEALKAMRDIARATHIESAASVAGARLADVQRQAAELTLQDKQRVSKLQEEYVNPETAPKRREEIADQLYTMLGKDKYTALFGKDDSGNPVFLGAFNTRSGELRGNDARRTAPGDRPPLGQFFGGGGGSSTPARQPQRTGPRPGDEQTDPMPQEESALGIIGSRVRRNVEGWGRAFRGED